MRYTRQAVSLILCILVLLQAGAQEADTLRFAKDTTIRPDEYVYGFFDRAEKVANPSSVMVTVRNKKPVTLTKFMNSLNTFDSSIVPEPIYHGLADLDNDGTKELVISSFTGGAHCCDEIYVFENMGKDKFRQTAKLFAGNTLVTDSNTFVFDFHEKFGYFFTCFACGYEDTSDVAAVPMQDIELKYKKGKFSVIQGNQELKSTINDNLGKLVELPYEMLESEIDQDNGIRKEIAMNLAVFYYRFGKNMVATKALFDKYYKHPDAAKVWRAFTSEIKSISSQNSF